MQGLADQGNWRELEAVLDGYLQKRVHLEDSSSALALAYESCHTKDSFLEQWIPFDYANQYYEKKSEGKQDWN